MSKLVQYKISGIPCQILVRFVFVSVSALVFFCLFGAGQIIFLTGINATENTVSVVLIYSWFIRFLGA